eukprot:Gb_05776 [translate_table: standard]
MVEGEEFSKKKAAQEAPMRKLQAQIQDLEDEKKRLNSKLQVEEAKEAEALADACANSEAKTELERRLREATDREVALEELRETISIQIDKGMYYACRWTSY